MRRKRFFSARRFQYFFGAYLFATILLAVSFISKEYVRVLFYGYMVPLYSKRLDIVLKILLVPGWAIITFLFVGVYMNLKMLGVFNRIKNVCDDLANGVYRRLVFRKTDSFAYVGNSFNKMVDKLAYKQSGLSKTLIEAKNVIAKCNIDEKSVEELNGMLDGLIYNDENKS